MDSTTTTSHSDGSTSTTSQTTAPSTPPSPRGSSQVQYQKKKAPAAISSSFRKVVFVAFIAFIVFIQIFRFFANGSGFVISNSLSKASAALTVNNSQLRQGRAISSTTTAKNNNSTLRNTTRKSSSPRKTVPKNVSRDASSSSSSTLEEASNKPASIGSNDAMTISNNGTSIVAMTTQKSKIRASISSLLLHNDTAASASASSSLPKPPHTLGAFIHVGKTGGSTLCSQLRNACHSWVKKPCNPKVIQSGNESHVSRFTTYYHTPDFDKLQKEKRKYEFYVWTLRDPFSRLLSAFTYQHPRNMGFAKDDTYWAKYVRASIPAFSCFPSLESFATAIGDEPDDFDYPFDPKVVNNTDCTRLARAMMHSKVLTNPSHLFYNIQAIHNRWMMPANASSATATATANNNNATAAAILVIRTENMWNDWTTANQWLGQEGHVATFPHIRARQQNATKLPVTKDISALGRKRLCRALRDEYEVYFHLIQRAVNLDEQERQAAYELARRNCPDNDFTTE